MSDHRSFERLVLDALDIIVGAVLNISGATYSPEQLKAWGEAKDKFVKDGGRVCYHRGAD